MHGKRTIEPRQSPNPTPSIDINSATAPIVSSSSTEPPAPSRSQPAGQPANTTGISGGAAAGIGIGGLVLGALLAFLATFLFMKRSRKQHRSQRHFNSFGTEKATDGAQPGSSILDETLLDRADDSQLRKSMQDLNEMIDQHVENHYHSEAIAGTSQNALEKALSEAGYSTDEDLISVSKIASLLINPRTRFAAIREVIARILVGNLMVNSRPEVCLLPKQIVDFVKYIPPVERLPGAEEGIYTQDLILNPWVVTSRLRLITGL